MSAGVMFRLVQGCYWLALGTWVGALVMLAIAAAVTFRTVRDYQPLLQKPPYNQPALADRAVPILAGGVVGNMLRALAVLQIICAAVVGTCIGLQSTLWRDQLEGGAAGWPNLVRVGLLALAVSALAVDQRWITPRIWAHREVMFDPDETAEVRAASQTAFNRLHKLDERVVGASVWLLAGAVFASAFVFKAGR